MVYPPSLTVVYPLPRRSVSTPIPYVLRYLHAWDAVITNASTDWNEAASLCVGLDGALYQVHPTPPTPSWWCTPSS